MTNLFKRPLSRHLTLRTWRQFAFMKAYYFQWGNMKAHISFRMSSPLLELNVYKNVQLKLTRSKNKKLVVFSSNLSVIAGKVAINNYRMPLLEVLSKVSGQLHKNNVLQISLYPAIKYAEEWQVKEQLQQLLQRYIQNQIRIDSTFNKSKSVSLNPKLGNLFPILLKFNLNLWQNQSYIPRHLVTSHPIAPKTGTSNFYMQAHWILCHFYRIISLPLYQQMTSDIKSLKEILNKFDFVEFLTLYYERNHIKKQAKICQFVRTFKWKNPETEKYLVFLIKSFGSNSFVRMIEDYIFIAEEYSKNQQIEQSKSKDKQVKKGILFKKRK